MRPRVRLAAEITREKLFLRLHQELPYQSTVETETWKELRDGSVRIEQTIYVERESQRKIVLGKNGQTIKAIGAESRKELSELFEHPVHLFLFVKVREGWGDDPERYRRNGIGISQGVGIWRRFRDAVRWNGATTALCSAPGATANRAPLLN